MHGAFRLGVSAANVVVGIGAVRGLVAAGAPAGSLHETGGMVFRRVADGVAIDLADASDRRRLQVAAETEVAVAGDQHLLIHRTVRAVAGNAAFLHRAMFENEGTLLRGVALGAGFILTLHRRARALDGITGVDVMAIRTGDFAGEHGVRVGQAELTAFLEMTGKAGLG